MRQRYLGIVGLLCAGAVWFVPVSTAIWNEYGLLIMAADLLMLAASLNLIDKDLK